jgi:hypothetical protein
MLTAMAQYLRLKQLRPLSLGLGAAVGILLAVTGALAPTRGTLPDNVVARVNDKIITRSDLLVAQSRLAADGRVSSALTARPEALHFLIDQELLIQRGVDIGLLESDRTVRKAIATAMIDAVVAKVLQDGPTEEHLRTFFDSHIAVFTVPARMHVQLITFNANGDSTRAHERAEEASAALRQGMSFADARTRYGDTDSVPIPDALVPLHVLYRDLGPRLTEAALALPARGISQPLLSPSGYHLLHQLEVQPEQIRPYETVRLEVKAEYVRRRRDDALEHYLAQLREKAEIVWSPKVLPGQSEGER